MRHHPRKRFGQNFLHDQFIIHKIIEAISPQENDHLVEIGPGLGALTLHLLPLVKKMDAIEIDRDLVPLLEKKSDTLGELKIHQQDVLTVDFKLLQFSDEKLRIVGNLPYNISTPLLFHLFEQKTIIEDMHFMLQKEVVDRLSAKPNTKAYGRLSILAQYHCNIEPLFNVPPEAFRPAPKVQSAVLCLRPKAPTIVAKDLHLLSEIVKTAFNQRRKTIKNTLKGLANEDQLKQSDISPTDRPESVPLENFVLLANVIKDKKGI